jgi:hypothetical protein
MFTRKEVIEMTDYSNTPWRSWESDPPPLGARLLLKMADCEKNAFYAIGITDIQTPRKLEYSALEQSETDVNSKPAPQLAVKAEPAHWMLIP